PWSSIQTTTVRSTHLASDRARLMGDQHRNEASKMAEADRQRQSVSPIPALLLDRREFLAAAGAALAGSTGLSRGGPGEEDSKRTPNHMALVVAVGKTDGAKALGHTYKEAGQFVEWLINKAEVPRGNIRLLVSADQPVDKADFQGITPGEATGDAIMN